MMKTRHFMTFSLGIHVDLYFKVDNWPENAIQEILILHLKGLGKQFQGTIFGALKMPFF